MDPRGRFSILWSSRDPIPRWSHEPSEIKRPRRGRIRCPNLTVELFRAILFPHAAKPLVINKGKGICLKSLASAPRALHSYGDISP